MLNVCDAHCARTHAYELRSLPATNNAPSVAAEGTIAAHARAPETRSLLVLPSTARSTPLYPLLVAMTLAATVAVFTLFVTAVVANVCVCVAASSAAAVSKKTRTAPGAGTRMEQICAVVSQGTVSTVSVPERRPSASPRPPNVCENE